LKLKYNSLIISLLFGIIGSIWAISSPIGSSADDNFHLTTIFCAKDSKQCLKTSVPDQVLIERTIGEFPPCYVGFPAGEPGIDRNYSKSSGECLKDIPKEFIETNKFNQYQQYPNTYYNFMANFVTDNTLFTVYFLRVLNVGIASFLILLLLNVASNHIVYPFTRMLLTAIYPVGIFFIASNNPSSWMITGLITNWAFLAATIINLKTNQSKLIVSGSIVGYLVSGLLAAVSRFDSVYYLFFLNISVLILFIDRKILGKYFLRILPAFLLVIFISITMFFQNSGGGRVLGNIISKNYSYIPASSTSGQPNSIVNTLLELPSYILSIFGGQRPYWTQFSGELPWEYAYGVGWLDFSFPSIVSILLVFSMVLLFANSLDAYTKKNVVVLFLVLISIVIYIVGWRLLKNYEPYYYFQPRYLAGFIIASFGVLLTTLKTKVVGKLQSVLIVMSTTTASVTAWAAVSARYSLGPNYAWSNFTNSESWLVNELFSRPRLFLFLTIFTLLLNYLLVVNKKVNFLESRKN
jgi:hypothetical protein